MAREADAETCRPLDGEPHVGPVARALGAADLLAWFAEHGRALPWRLSREPWEILVAELMLQQTQVARVVDRWPRFLARFPDPAACAGAPVADVITEWAGLGYNRRAVNLHRAAAMLVEHHGGHFPEERDALLALPGVGPYTARAVRAFAYEADDGVLDTNVSRILARVGGRRLGAAEAQSMADGAVPAGGGWAWNQAMLDVGALHCTARNPHCDACPLRSDCAWLASGCPEPDPARGSAGGSGRQSRFAGSDRQGRGRLVAALIEGPVAIADLPDVLGWPDDRTRATRVAETLVRDGLAILDHETVRLPGS